MIKVLSEIFLSLFFVYGFFSAMAELKAMLKKYIKRLSAIDKSKK